MEPNKMDIEVALLNVDLGNFRIGSQDTPRDAYQAMLADQKDNLKNLADDIVKIGLSPADLFMVCPDPEKAKHYIVLEGNRRITAIKMLETPALTTGTKEHKKFQELSKIYQKKPIKKVSCVIFENKDQAFIWIERKHTGAMGGRGIVQWDANATSNADAYRGNIRPSKAIIDQLKAKSLLTASLEKKVIRQTTNLDRVFQMPYLKDALGIQFEQNGKVIFENGDDKKGNQLLVKMLEAMGVDGFTVDDIRYDSNRKDFIDQFAQYSVKSGPKVVAGGKASTAEGTTKGATKKATKKKVASPLDRRSLALKGKDYSLSIKEKRLNALYDEALALNPEILPHCAMILTRVMIELSTDHFLIKKKVALPTKHSQKSNWTDLGINLHDKIRAVLSILDPTGKSVDYKDIRVALAQDDALHAVDTLHKCIHNLKSDSDAKTAKIIWGRWHVYLAGIFDTLG